MKLNRLRLLPARQRRGNIAVPALLSLGVIMAVGAITIDLGILRVRRVEMQNAVDAAAHAGAAQLDGTEAGIYDAELAAEAVARANFVGDAGVSLDSDETDGRGGSIRFGRWADGAFQVTSDPTRVTAVEVVGGRADLPTVFSRIAFGRATLAVTSTAVAQGGGVGQSDCPIPIAIPSCSLEAGAGVCTQSLVLNADGGDNAAWANLGGSRPSASSVRSMLASCSTPADSSDVVTLNNGTINSAMKALADAVSASTTSWNTAEWGDIPAQSPRSGVTSYGRVFTGQMIVFEDPASCHGTKYNGSSLPVAGFVQAAVYDVTTSGAASSRRIGVRLSCDVEEQQGGGGFYGKLVPPSLVQ